MKNITEYIAKVSNQPFMDCKKKCKKLLSFENSYEVKNSHSLILIILS